MKYSLFSIVLILSFLTINLEAQKNRLVKRSNNKPPVVQKNVETLKTGVVVDERLAVLRSGPSLFARPIQRLRRGRIVLITSVKEADGVTFYRVTSSSKTEGWIQSEAIAGKFRRGDDERLARLVQGSEGFDRIERARIFLEHFPDSPLRPAILLLFGDLMEEIALKLSGEAAKRLTRREMAASGAPLHSFYLNYAGLDRYERLGIVFLFNPATRLFHYDGAAWREIVTKFPKNAEVSEAQKRLASLKEKMEKTP